MEHRVEIVPGEEVAWADLRELRLRALLDAPQAFAQSYDVARAFPDHVWQQRIEEAKAGTSWLVCARMSGRLVGMVGAFQPDDDRDHHRVTVVSTYVDPMVRGQGIGQRMLTALLNQLAMVRELTVARLAVNAEQIAAVCLYQAAGFHIVSEGSVTLGDGLLHSELIMERSLRCDSR